MMSDENHPRREAVGGQVARRAGRPVAAAQIPRERILGAAAALFRARGYSATTVRDIAREVGITSSSLFHHFESKEQMLAEIQREATLSMCLGAEAIVARTRGTVERLRELVRFELNCFVGGTMRDYFAALVTEWRDVPAAVQPEMRALRRRYHASIDAALEACASEGRLRVAPDAAATVLHGFCTSTFTWSRVHGRSGMEDMADTVTALLLTKAD